MCNEKEDRSELEVAEFHPAYNIAKRIIQENIQDAHILLESMSSCAIEGNRLAEVCAGTLERILRGDPVGERYVMGLALMLLDMGDKL